jgi:hypothetical protein
MSLLRFVLGLMASSVRLAKFASLVWVVQNIKALTAKDMSHQQRFAHTVQRQSNVLALPIRLESKHGSVRLIAQHLAKLILTGSKFLIAASLCRQLVFHQPKQGR